MGNKTSYVVPPPDRIFNFTNLDKYTRCPHCGNDTRSYVSTWGDKPISCMGCKGSKEEGKKNSRHPWQDDQGNDTRPSGLYDLRNELKCLILQTSTEQPGMVDWLKEKLRKLGESDNTV